MTQIVTVLYCEYHFQYVERRFSGFVALSFVAGTDTGRDAIENKELKRDKKYRCHGANPGIQAALIWRIDKIISTHGNH